MTTHSENFIDTIKDKPFTAAADTAFKWLMTGQSELYFDDVRIYIDEKIKEIQTGGSVFILHDADLDGNTAAACTAAYLNAKYPDITVAFSEVLHGKPFEVALQKLMGTSPEDLKKTIVIVLDHQLMHKYFELLNGKTAMTLWIDHHPVTYSAEEEPIVSFDRFLSFTTNCSAALGAWIFFSSVEATSSEPHNCSNYGVSLLQHVSAYDTWQFNMAEDHFKIAVKGMSAWFFKDPESKKTLFDIMHAAYNEKENTDAEKRYYALMQDSESIFLALQAGMSQIEKKFTVKGELASPNSDKVYKCAFVHHSDNMSHLLHHILLNDGSVNYALCIYVTAKGDYHVTVRSLYDNFDCQEIVKPYGGGGHRCAAGMMLTKVQYIEFVKRCTFNTSSLSK
jgi:oligoribonuclease NrnB/cAMP/cGMP phosphodiesterase (DHH superfamily)